ncbi:conserved protein of unknown function [uncultured Sphingopyxis sp.]|uniref:DUF2793 domain-containing protein n=1 Tax=uncultured Sphingopyxis sp. TaxID=310581 RepID=A0A1Y5PV76_9SPHN|nr:DUF2793 domain-containing protein [uncultured Sphingopyxis sp.]SBV33933.1 conserved protein of unknown function [uncultured Sphingopyxis sp.]
MTDMPITPRFALPLLAVAQAQKEVTHNEALTLLDALVHAAIEAGPLAAPPANPAIGQCWIVDTAAAGAWAGESNAIAIWTAGGWRFAAPRAGVQVTRLADGARLRFDGSEWTAPATVSAPTGGTTVDSEARDAITALILNLAAQGILISG